MFIIVSNILLLVTPLGGRQLAECWDKQQLVTNITHTHTHTHIGHAHCTAHASSDLRHNIGRRCARSTITFIFLVFPSSPYGRHAWPGAVSERLKIALESSERGTANWAVIEQYCSIDLRRDQFSVHLVHPGCCCCKSLRYDVQWQQLVLLPARRLAADLIWSLSIHRRPSSSDTPDQTRLSAAA